jgi:hypothetical protein
MILTTQKLNRLTYEILILQYSLFFDSEVFLEPHYLRFDKTNTVFGCNDFQ